MTDPIVEPLEPQLWLDRLATLHADAMGEENKPAESMIRKAFYLTVLAPGPYRDLLAVDADEGRVEDMLACGAYESAMLALIKPETGVTVQKPKGAEKFSVEVMIDPDSPPGKSKHKEYGKAVLCAWVCALSHIAGIDVAGGSTNPGPHKSRSGSPPSSTAH